MTDNENETLLADLTDEQLAALVIEHEQRVTEAKDAYTASELASQKASAAFAADPSAKLHAASAVATQVLANAHGALDLATSKAFPIAAHQRRRALMAKRTELLKTGTLTDEDIRTDLLKVIVLFKDQVSALVARADKRTAEINAARAELGHVTRNLGTPEKFAQLDPRETADRLFANLSDPGLALLLQSISRGG